MQMKTDGIILREVMLGESDKIVTILTRDFGVIGALVKNARNIRSKKASGVAAMTYSRLCLFERGGRYIVDGAEVLEQFMGLRANVINLSLAAYFGELARCLAPEGEPAEGFLRLMLNSIHLLCKGEHPISQIKAVFELRAMELSGHMPDLVGCAGCGCYEHETMFFYPDQGKIFCGACFAAQARGFEQPIPLPPGVLAAMRHIIYSDFDRIFSFSLSKSGLAVLEKTTETNLTAQLDRRFQTLDFYRSMLGDLHVQEHEV